MDPAPRLHGMLPSLVTPFAESGGVDLDALGALARFAAGAGAHGLMCLGLAGEVWKLTTAERQAVVEEVVRASEGRLPVLPGVGAASAAEAVALARHAEAVGASVLVVPPPAGGPLDRDALVGHLAAVAGAVAIPVMIQNAAASLGVALTPDIVVRVAERCDNVRLVKLEAAPDELARWVAALGPDFGVFGGDAGVYTVDAAAVGAAGIAPGAEVIDRLVAVWRELEDDPDGATAALGALLPLLALEMVTIENYVAAAKYVLGRRGIIPPAPPRAPAADLAPPTLRVIDRHLVRLGLLNGGPGDS
jgi:4-hydroxy-tetrahydrodipicolinate synthase